MDNYFAFYGLEPKLNIDEEKLRAEYLKLSKENHPDFFVNDAEKHALALEKTSLNNRAYQCLRTIDGRQKHILELSGLLKESGSEVPQEFLMEMMEFNETIMELQMDFDQMQYEFLVEEKNKRLLQQLKELGSIGQFYDSASEDEKKQLNQQLLDNYLKQKYLLRVAESLEAILQ
jgi:molecular chaperone HscB